MINKHFFFLLTFISCRIWPLQRPFPGILPVFGSFTIIAVSSCSQKIPTLPTWQLLNVRNDWANRDVRSQSSLRTLMSSIVALDPKTSWNSTVQYTEQKSLLIKPSLPEMPDECPLSRDHVHIASYECEWVFGGRRRSSLEQAGCLAHVSAPQGCCVVYHLQYECSLNE